MNGKGNKKEHGSNGPCHNLRRQPNIWMEWGGPLVESQSLGWNSSLGLPKYLGKVLTITPQCCILLTITTLEFASIYMYAYKIHIVQATEPDNLPCWKEFPVDVLGQTNNDNRILDICSSENPCGTWVQTQ